MKAFLVLLLFIVGVSPTQDANISTLFEQGNQAYNNADYLEAISAYKSILEQGQHSSALYFNLANCYYKNNQVAESIYYYEKALLLNPEDQEIQHNAAFAKNMTLDSIEELPKTALSQLKSRIMKWLTIDQWGGVFLVFTWLGVGFFSWYLWSTRPFTKRLTLLMSMLIMGLSSSLFILTNERLNVQQQTKFGIIFNTQVEILNAPNERGEMQFLLHEGTKVEVLDELQDWQKIRIANGAEGWVKGAKIRVL